MPGERIYSFLSIPYDPCLVNLAVIIKKHFELLKGEDTISQVVSTSKSPFILFSIPTMEAIFCLKLFGCRVRDLLTIFKGTL